MGWPMDVVKRIRMMHHSAVSGEPSQLRLRERMPSSLKDVVEQAVIGVEHPLPHHRHGHGAGHDGQVEHAAVEGGVDVPEPVDDRRHPQGEEAYGGHAGHHDDHGVDEGLSEDGVREELGVVLKPDEAEVGHGVVERAGHQTHAHREDDKPQEKQQAGRHEQIARNVLAAPRGFQLTGNADGFLHAGTPSLTAWRSPFPWGTGERHGKVCGLTG